MIHVADTHALVWFLEGDRRLSRRAREALRDAKADLVVPTIVLAEIAHLYGQERIEVSAADVLASVAGATHCTVYPLDEAVVERLPSGLDIHDAIIVATALMLRDTFRDSVAVITKDAEIAGSRLIDVIW